MTKEQLIDKRRQLEDLFSDLLDLRKNMILLYREPPMIIASDVDCAGCLMDLAISCLDDARDELDKILEEDYDCK